MKFFKHIRNAMNQLNKYDISTHAASASFFLLTSILPVLMLVLSILSWVGLEMDEALLDDLFRLLPGAFRNTFDYVMHNLQDVGAAEFSISVIALFWTASKGMVGLVDGLNNIAGTEDRRNFIFKRIFCLVYMLVLLAGLILTLGLRVFGHAILDSLQRYIPYVGYVFEAVMDFRGVTLYIVITLIIALIYSIFPNKKMPLLKQIPGAAIAAAAWLIFSAVYSVYVQYATSSSAIYGGMGIVIFAMLWIYFCVYIIFIGAVINKLYSDVVVQIWKKMKENIKKRKQRKEIAMLFLEYPKCSTCQKAKKWLDENGLEYTDRHIVEHNPSYEELKEWYERSGLPLKSFFNTSGLLYKELQLKDKLPTMSEKEQLELLATNGMLVKRPLIVKENLVLTGFKEAQWEEKLK